MDIRQLYTRNSEYLTAEDIDGRNPVLTIKHAEPREKCKVMQGGKQTERPGVLLWFEKAKKPMLITNQSNKVAMKVITGSWDTDDWAGVTVQLYTEDTRMGPGIRIRRAPRGGK